MIRESLYEAWQCYKGMLLNFPQHDLNVQQEITSFYDGINGSTRQLFDSQGPMPKKDPTTNNAFIEEFVKHSWEYHNPREDVTRGKSNGDGGQDNTASKIEKLNSMYKTIIKMGK